MQAYLKEAPEGQFAVETQKKLAQIEKGAANAGSKSHALPTQKQTAPYDQRVAESERPRVQQALVEMPAAKISAAPGGMRTKADLWSPPDIDRVIPQALLATTCPLSDVLSQAGKRIEELVHNVDKFTATEVVEHQNVDR